MQMLPQWLYPWVSSIVLGAQITLLIVGAWLLRALFGRLVRRTSTRHGLPPEFTFVVLLAGKIVIYGAALLLVLDRLGVSATVLWTAFTGFAAVAAVAFFAAWSVLSNIFCSFLIFVTGIVRLHDHIEVVENGQTAGLRGQVIDINLIYTTVQEHSADGSGSTLKFPNSMFFQRITRTWPGEPPAPVVAPTGAGAASQPPSGGATP